MRAQVAIKLDKAPGSAYTIRIAANVAPQMISGYAVLQYASLDGTTAEFVKAEGYPALPPSKPSVHYSGALLTTATGLSHNATDFDDYGTGAAPFVASSPPGNDQVAQTFFFDMSRPNGTIWAMNDTGLHQSLYEDNGPLIWDSVWRSVAADKSGVLGAHSIDFVNQKDAVVDLVFVVNENSYVVLFSLKARKY